MSNCDEKQTDLRSKDITTARWMDIFVLCVITLTIYFLLKPLFNSHILRFIEIIGNYPPFLLLLIYFVIFALIWIPAVRYGSLTTPMYLTYPPSSVAVLICLLFISFTELYTSEFSNWPRFLESLAWCFAVCVAACCMTIICFKIVYRFTRSENYNETNQRTEESLTVDPKSLLQWINEESPIALPVEDRFNTNIIAERIVDVLSKTPLTTVSVVGDYGSGKTSILNIVRHSLKSNEKSRRLDSKVILVDVCGWGLQKGTAPETILKQVVNSCADYFDCIKLSKLPTHYTASVGTLSDWSKALSILLSHSCDPMTTLNEMDQILLAINKKVIIFFEDLDRNWQDEGFWAEVISLLDRLKKLKQVSFILAITDTSKLTDTINRVSEHVEFIPKLSFRNFMKISIAFKRLCFQDCEVVAFQEEEKKYTKLIPDNEEDFDVLEKNGLIRRINESKAMTHLLGNPRNFKHALRRTYNAWKSLPGEIDFEVLFMVNTLRVSEPTVFNFIHENIADIQWLEKPAKAAAKAATKTEEKERLHGKLKDIVRSPSALENTSILLQCLFPSWESEFTSLLFYAQNLLTPEPTDYWERIIRERFEPGEISDQEFARGVNEWKNGKDDYNYSIYGKLQLAEAITKIDGFPEKLQQLGQYILNSEQVHRLTGQVFHLVFFQKGARNTNFKGSVQLKEVISTLILKERLQGANENTEKSFSHLDWLAEEATKLLPYNLLVAANIYGEWFLISSNDPIFDRDQMAAYGTVLANAKSAYSDNAVFINAIKPDGDSICEFIRVLRRKGRNTVSFDYSDFEWLADLLIKNININYSIIVPQILEFLVSFDDDNRWRLSPRLLEAFFQNKSRDVMIVLSQIDKNQFAGDLNIKAAVACEQATQWLSAESRTLQLTPVK